MSEQTERPLPPNIESGKDRERPKPEALNNKTTRPEQPTQNGTAPPAYVRIANGGK